MRGWDLESLLHFEGMQLRLYCCDVSKMDASRQIVAAVSQLFGFQATISESV